MNGSVLKIQNSASEISILSTKCRQVIEDLVLMTNVDNTSSFAFEKNRIAIYTDIAHDYICQADEAISKLEKTLCEMLKNDGE